MYEPPTQQTSSPPYAAGYAPMAPPQPRRRRAWPIALAATVITFALFVAAAVGYDRVIKTDSGIAACESMAQNRNPGTGQTNADEKWTEGEYLALRQVFRDSRHEDIRTAGLKMVDMLWQMTQQMSGDGDQAAGAALLFGGQMTQALTEMAGACANHGIVVKFDNT